jgi:hypothetical protein
MQAVAAAGDTWQPPEVLDGNLRFQTLSAACMSGYRHAQLMPAGAANVYCQPGQTSIVLLFISTSPKLAVLGFWMYIFGVLQYTVHQRT